MLRITNSIPLLLLTLTGSGCEDLTGGDGNPMEIDRAASTAKELCKKDDWPECLSAYQKGLESCRQRDLQATESCVVMLYSTCHAAMKMGEYSLAFQYCRDFLNMKDASKSSALVEEHIVNLMGVLFGETGYPKEAEKYLTRLYDICMLSNNPGCAAIPLHNLAFFHANRADYQEAFKLIEESLRLRRKAGDRAREGLGLLVLGGIEAESEIRRFDDAIKHFESAEQMLREGNHLSGLASELHQRGMTIAQHKGELEEGAALINEAFEISTSIPHKEGEALSLMDLGWIKFLQKKTAEAEDLLAHALDLAEEIGQLSIVAEILKLRGILLYRTMRFEKAVYYLQRSVDVARKMMMAETEAESRLYLGKIFRKEKLFHKAIGTLIEGREIAHGKNLRRIEMRILRCLAFIYLDMSLYDKAASYLEEALKIAKAVGDVEMQKKLAEEINRMGKTRSKEVASSETSISKTASLSGKDTNSDRSRSADILTRHSIAPDPDFLLMPDISFELPAGKGAVLRHTVQNTGNVDDCYFLKLKCSEKASIVVRSESPSMASMECDDENSENQQFRFDGSIYPGESLSFYLEVNEGPGSLLSITPTLTSCILPSLQKSINDTIRPSGKFDSFEFGASCKGSCGPGCFMSCLHTLFVDDRTGLEWIGFSFKSSSGSTACLNDPQTHEEIACDSNGDGDFWDKGDRVFSGINENGLPVIWKKGEEKKKFIEAAVLISPFSTPTEEKVEIKLTPSAGEARVFQSLEVSIGK